MSSEASDSSYTTFHSAASEFSQSAPTTPDEVTSQEDDLALLHLNLSQSTIRKLTVEAGNQPHLSLPIKKGPETNHRVTEENSPIEVIADIPPSPTPSASNGSKAPPARTRTPARTKRRSVSSTFSAPSSPTSPTRPIAQPPQDFISTFITPAPIVFSTPLERELLNNLSALGFDTGQMVHSVLTDACDSSGALWWMMRKKAERRALEEAAKKVEIKKDEVFLTPDIKESFVRSEASESGLDAGGSKQPSPMTQLSPSVTPEVGVVPPTPTVPISNSPMTPPRSTSPEMLSPTPSQTELQHRSSVSSPSSQNSKGRGTKPRSASISIMQRATTALEAAGLVRKKSDEKVRLEEHDKEREREKKDNHKVKEREEREKRPTSGDDSRSSGTSHKLTKSPPPRLTKDPVPTTPEMEPSSLSGMPSTTSPWIIHSSAPISSHVAPTPANSPGDSSSPLLPPGSVGSVGGKQQGRGRASILHTFRMWFNEDRKGKRKAAPPPHPLPLPHHHMGHSITTPTSAGSVRGGRAKRRSGSGSAPVRRSGHQKRPSASSRRSSSVNSRRSSVASAHKVPMDYQHVDDPFNPRRRSLGARTPTSERGDFPSRPSSIRSFQVTTPGLPPLPRRSHSPSEDSIGSGRRSIRRTDSPLQRYHRRGGSGSSTRVIRQIKTVHPHVRSNSVASSYHSAPSSRPGSYHESSEAELPPRNGSPFRPSSRQSDDTPRRIPYSTTVLVAHKKQTPFHQPSLTRSSWKKSWGVEPPGWKSRSTEAPFEVLFTDDPRTSVRDVFSGRPSLNLADDDDWVDEDDDVPFAGGLGQMPTSNSHPPPITLESYHKPEAIILSPPPRNSSRAAPSSKRTGNRNTIGRKASPSPVACTSPLPQTVEHNQPESRGARRQLPGRAEPAFRQAIQEEDEDEEEQ